MKVFLILASLAFTAVTGTALYKNSSNNVKTSSETVSIPGQTVTSDATSAKLLAVPTAKVNKAVTRYVLNPKRVIYLTTQVSFQSAQDLSNQIKQLNQQSSEPIYMLIDSPGGSVLDGAILASEMEASKAPVYTVCTRLCASMAAMLHSYGAKRFVLDRAVLMYHPASGGAGGQVPNMISQLTTIDRYINKMVANLVSKTKLSQAEFDKLVAYELWIDGEDAVNKGFADGIVNLNVPNYPGQIVTLEELPPEEQKRKPSTGFTEVKMIYPGWTR